MVTGKLIAATSFSHRAMRYECFLSRPTLSELMPYIYIYNLFMYNLCIIYHLNAGASPSWEQFVRESLLQAAWPVALVPPPRRALTVDHQ